MRRREFIALLGGAAALAARGARAAGGDAGDRVPQQPVARTRLPHRLRRSGKGLSEAGYVEGRTSPSNIAGRKINTIGCRRWLPIWFAARSP